VEKILENLWVLFISIIAWVVNRLTAKIDTLESDKASSSDLARQQSDMGELDKKIDTLNHTSIGRVEYKSDISLLHNRLNEKEDKIKTIRVESDK
tara:strand:- start:447 stop:731 length:285 start_codon:yes stop_codon:yes gene_type:complete